MTRGHRDVGGYRASFGAGEFTFAGDNPWTGNSPSKMKKGVVKFFNEAKGFVAGGGGGGGLRAGISTSRSNLRNPQTRGAYANGVSHGQDAIEVLFNPKEISISKVTVRGWDMEKKKQEGGRHTPFHNMLKTKHDTAKNSVGNIR